MNNPLVSVKKILLGGILFILLLPLLQQHGKFWKSKPLSGSSVVAEKVYFSKDSWFSGTFQDGYADWFNENFGFRNELVRLRNQVAYSLYHVARANDVIIGKDLYLYERNYITAYIGKDFIGLTKANDLVSKLAVLQDSLAAKNITLVVCLAPGKASFYPEYLPDDYGAAADTTNYKILSSLMNQRNVNVIDCVNWFGRMKGKTDYPLFPKTGTHWSQYGSMLALDSLLKFIEKKRSIDLPDMVWDGIDKSDSLQTPDDDIGSAMNLLWPIKGLRMGYPRIHFGDTTGKAKVRLMTISDSFFWQMYNLGLEPYPFSQVSFYYYNKELYRPHYDVEQPEATVDAVPEHDVVVIMVTEGNLKDFGWGFVRDAFDLFVAKTMVRTNTQRIAAYEEQIRGDEKWMNSIREKAFQRNISVDSAVHLDAIYLLQNEKPQ